MGYRKEGGCIREGRKGLSKNGNGRDGSKDRGGKGKLQKLGRRVSSKCSDSSIEV